jgi:hypothetical protein
MDSDVASSPQVAPPQGAHDHGSQFLGVDVVGFEAGAVSAPVRVQPIPMAEGSAGSGACICINIDLSGRAPDAALIPTVT